MTKVTDYWVAILAQVCEQDVLWFEVSVDDSLFVEMFQTRCNSPRKVLRSCLRKYLELALSHVHLQVPTGAESSDQKCFFFVFDQLDKLKHILVTYCL